MNELIEGVNILNTLQYHDMHILQKVVIITLLGIFILKVITFIFNNVYIHEKIIPLIILFILEILTTIICLLFIIIGLILFINGIPAHEVTINKNVSYTEFTDKYEVLKKMGLYIQYMKNKINNNRLYY